MGVKTTVKKKKDICPCTLSFSCGVRGIQRKGCSQGKKLKEGFANKVELTEA